MDDLIRRSDAIRVASGYCHWTNIPDELAKLPSVNPKPCEDAISRQAVLDAVLLVPIAPLIKGDNVHYERVVYENVIKDLPSVTPAPKMGRCKDCKWWKDSDGVYRRGVGAESQCPINRKEVYEGNGYCFMFEAKMGGVEE